MHASEIIELIMSRDERGIDELLRHFGPLMRYVIAPILSDEADYMSKTIGDVMEIGYDLDAGEKSAVIDQNGYLFLVQCLSKTEHDYKPFEDVKVNIEKILREEHYDQVVEEKAESLQVDCNYEDIYSFTLENIN